MKKILLVKTSSLGDVVHSLPVVTDVARHFPGAQIDWAVEEAFAALPALHPAVRRVIPVAVRRWRKQLFNSHTWREAAAFRREIKRDTYDVVIDTQGLVKSALIAHCANGERHGFDAASARESLAARFYDVDHAVPNGLHAVIRNRRLAAAALDYGVEDAADYGLGGMPSDSADAYCVLLHATSRSDKYWAESQWIELGRWLSTSGIRCVLPWGSEVEFASATRIAASIPGASVAPRLDLVAMARLLAGARATVGVDTGLTHLSAALGRPTVALFCASSPVLTGIYGARFGCNLGAPGAPPEAEAVIQALNELCLAAA